MRPQGMPGTQGSPRIGYSRRGWVPAAFGQTPGGAAKVYSTYPLVDGIQSKQYPHADPSRLSARRSILFRNVVLAIRATYRRIKNQKKQRCPGEFISGRKQRRG